MALSDIGDGKLVITFDELLRRTPLAKRMTRMLQLLEEKYQAPVDTEFTLEIVDPNSTTPDVKICLLQCRPQSHLQESEARLPKNLAEQDIIFSTPRMAPEGRVRAIKYVLFVPPEAYYRLATPAERAELGRIIGKLNKALKTKTFICVGPGRWGTSNPDLGVKIGYSDIYYTRALVELTGVGIGNAPEASFGTHFFQDLMESNIFPLAIYLQDAEAVFNRDFFYKTPNRLLDFLPDETKWVENLRLIEVSSFRANRHMELVMDDDQGRSVAFLEHDL